MIAGCDGVSPAPLFDLCEVHYVSCVLGRRPSLEGLTVDQGPKLLSALKPSECHVLRDSVRRHIKWDIRGA